MSKTRIYISGPISGTTDYMARFEKAEKDLSKNGYRVINSAKLTESLPLNISYEEIMELGLLLLGKSDAIYMLKGWEKSCGSNREYGFALAAGIDIIKE